MLRIISFGQTGYYSSITNKLLKKLKDYYPGAVTTLYTEKDLPIDYLKYAKLNPRGYGFMRWKPYILSLEMEKAPLGDIIFYLDGRCGFFNKNISFLDKFVSDESKDVLAWRLNKYLEIYWTSKEIFSHFEINEKDRMLRTGQFATGFFAIRKNNNTSKFVQEWKSKTMYFPELFSDSGVGADEKFIENRHDQSAFSILLKLSSKELKILELNDEDVFSEDSMIIQFSSHNIRFASIKNFIKTIIRKRIRYQRSIAYFRPNYYKGKKIYYD
jgi:hypothetical protein